MAHMDSASDEEDAGLSINIDRRAGTGAHPRCMPCYGARLLASPMVFAVFGLVLLTYLPYVVTNTRNDFIANVCKFILTVLVVLMLASYLQCVLIDPGTAPEWWVQQAESAPPGTFERCRKSNLPKPPRSHYDSVTNRLVLNMDHFCPWVANTVGFYNRKFFVLFLIYAFLACSFAAATSLLLFREQLFPVGCKRRRCPPNTLLLVSIVINGVFGLMLCCFSMFHVGMALSNETTIEHSAYVDFASYYFYDKFIENNKTSTGALTTLGEEKIGNKSLGQIQSCGFSQSGVQGQTAMGSNGQNSFRSAIE